MLKMAKIINEEPARTSQTSTENGTLLANRIPARNAKESQSNGIHAVRLNNLPGDRGLFVSIGGPPRGIVQVVEELGKASH
jgi:hypothetical protein